jgi:hypothetical protein
MRDLLWQSGLIYPATCAARDEIIGFIGDLTMRRARLQQWVSDAEQLAALQ